MHIGLDGRSFFTGGTGDRTYFRDLIGEMARLAPENRYTLYYRERDADREAFADSFPNLATQQASARIGWLWGQTAIAPRMRRDAVDVFHAQYLLPPIAPRPTVVTIHDITFHLFPQWSPARTRRIMNTLIPLAARTAKRIITGSESAKRDIVRCFKIKPEKIIVTPYAVARHFQPMEKEQAKAIVAKRYNLEAPYVLGVGLRGGRKNPGVVVRAILEIQKAGQWPAGTRLALTGQIEHFSDPEIQQCREQISFLGYVPDEDLPALYSAATACVYPSLYEGFGLPPLEAMACGCPILSSNTSSMPEVVGDAGFLLAPTDDNAWVQALSAVLNSPELQSELSEKGLQRARQFSWERTARQTLEVYRQAIAG